MLSAMGESVSSDSYTLTPTGSRNTTILHQGVFRPFLRFAFALRRQRGEEVAADVHEAIRLHLLRVTREDGNDSGHFNALECAEIVAVPEVSLVVIEGLCRVDHGLRSQQTKRSYRAAGFHHMRIPCLRICGISLPPLNLPVRRFAMDYSRDPRVVLGVVCAIDRRNGINRNADRSETALGSNSTY